MMKKVADFMEKLIQMLFIVFLAICCFFGVICHGDVDQTTYAENINYVFNNPRLIVWLVGYIVFLFVMVGLKKWDEDRTVFLFVFLCGVVAAAAAVAFSVWNGYTPVSDQEQLWEGGIQLVYGDSVAFKSDYFERNHNQAGGALLAALLIRATGSRNFMNWRIVNSVCVGLILYGLSCLSQIYRRNNRSAVMTALLTLLFLPLIIYAPLVYGTLTSLAFSIWAFVFLLCYFKQGQRRYALFAIGLCVIANLAYSGTMIVTLAMFFTCIFYAVRQWPDKKSLFVRTILVAVVLVFACTVSSYAARKYFYEKTKISDAQGMPASAYIYMGLTSDDEHSVCGPGSYNSGNVNLYLENNRDAKLTQKNAREKIEQAVKEYLTGQRSLSFFVKKIRNQWADPWFSSMIMVINYYDIDRPLKESFRVFLSGPLIGKIQTFLTAYRIIIYFAALVYGLHSFKKQRENEIAHVERTLLFMFFVGGFVFYIIWEAKARYCIPYFVLLIPLSAIELTDIFVRLRSKNDKENT